MLNLQIIALERLFAWTILQKDSGIHAKRLFGQAYNRQKYTLWVLLTDGKAEEFT